MKGFKSVALVVTAGVCFTAAATSSQAQISINIGAPPVCPYGYFDYPPYACAPFGYYGPNWFVGGVFVGTGPWFHGPANFHGRVDNHFDPRHGYHGAMPSRGAHVEHGRRPGAVPHFRGNEMHDAHGHVEGGGHPR